MTSTPYPDDGRIPVQQARTAVAAINAYMDAWPTNASDESGWKGARVRNLGAVQVWNEFGEPQVYWLAEFERYQLDLLLFFIGEDGRAHRVPSQMFLKAELYQTPGEGGAA